VGNIEVTSSPVKVAGRGLARQTLIVVSLAFLACAALYFYLQDVLHFALDYTEPNFGRLWPNRLWLLLHVAGGSVALFFGPFQLWSGLRQRHLSIHRWTGRLYLGGVFVGGAAAFFLSFYTQPRDFGVALFVQATAWWLSVGMGFLAIKRYRIEVHKAWMIRGYVVTFAFVTFRLWIDLPLLSHLGSARLSTVAWLSWLLPLLVAEALLRRKRALLPPQHRERIPSRRADGSGQGRQ
jgi:hypothetical protein